MKKRLNDLKYKMLIASMVAMSPAIFAEGATYPDTVSVSGLWDYLSTNFGKIVNETFDKLAAPVGIVISVVFVMAIFFFSVGLIRKGLTNRFRG